MRIPLISMAVVLACLAHGAIKAAEQSRGEVSSLEFAVDLPTADLRGQAFLDERGSAITQLINQVDTDRLTADQKAWPIYLLGEVRATQAIPFLLQHIDLSVSNVEPKDRIGRWGLNPAVQALSKIGKPASQVILAVFPSEADDGRRRLMLDVIYDVEGADAGVYLLEERLSRVKDNKERSRLQNALAILKAFKDKQGR